MGYSLLLLCLLLFGGWYFQRWSQLAGPERTKQVLKKVGLGALVVIAILLAIRSGSVLVALLPVLAVAFNRILTVLSLLSRYTPLAHWLSSHLAQRSARPAGSTHAAGGSAQPSSISTKYFAMTLDQANGVFDGTVHTGSHAGATLSQLDLPVLLTLYQDVADDPQSQAVLEAFLDYRFGDHWRQQSGTGNHKQHAAVDLNTDMTPSQAYAVLGLKPGASEGEIRQSHRRLSQRLHPDQGGNDALCSLINQARDLLLKN